MISNTIGCWRAADSGQFRLQRPGDAGTCPAVSHTLTSTGLPSRVSVFARNDACRVGGCAASKLSCAHRSSRLVFPTLPAEPDPMLKRRRRELRQLCGTNACATLAYVHTAMRCRPARRLSSVWPNENTFAEQNHFHAGHPGGGCRWHGMRTTRVNVPEDMDARHLCDKVTGKAWSVLLSSLLIGTPADIRSSSIMHCKRTYRFVPVCVSAYCRVPRLGQGDAL